MRILGPTVFLVAILLAACSSSGEPVYESLLRCPDCPLLEVTRIIDGDTFDSPRGKVRLFGADTPERGQRCYRSATKRLRELAGDAVRIQLGPRLVDPSGRLLYYAYTSAGDSIDEALIREGFGRAWTRDGQWSAANAALTTIGKQGHWFAGSAATDSDTANQSDCDPGPRESGSHARNQSGGRNGG